MEPIRRKILQAIAATMALPAIACSNSGSSSSTGDSIASFDSPPGTCTITETPDDAFVVDDASLEAGDAGPGNECFALCGDADPVGKRVCCVSPSYQCDEDGG